MPVELVGGWRAHRDVFVRSAGFPARSVLALAGGEAARAADALHAAERAHAALREQAIQALRAAPPADEALARAARRAREALGRGRPVEHPALVASVPALQALATHAVEVAARRDELERAYAAEVAAAVRTLGELAGEPRFREAVTWQNAGAVRTALDWLRAHPGETGAVARPKLQLVARYLQRYAVKNDTIGFFGPLAWARFGDGDGVAARPGPALLRARATSFEAWAIDTLGGVLADVPGVRPFAPPRLLPGIRLDGDVLRLGPDRQTRVSPPVARVLAGCDGHRPARDLARALVADPASGITDEGDVLDLLEQLARKKLITWTLEPTALIAPEVALRRLLARVEPAELRARVLSPLDRLEAARSEVAAAAGDATALAAALARLDAVFVEVTGAAATRKAGQTYAGRTLAYEDCVRDLDLELGRTVTARMAPVLELLGSSARWFTHEVATRFRATFTSVHARLAAAATAPVRFVAFLAEVDDALLSIRRSPEALEVAEELSRRWLDVLGVDLAARRCALTIDAIAPRARAAFAAPRPGWPGARHVSPDVMIAAASVDAVARGDFSIVIGEVHLNDSLLVRMVIPHPPGEGDPLIRAYEADLDRPRVFPVISAARGSRAANLPWSPRDLDLEIGLARSWREPAQVLRAGDLVMDASDGTLRVRDERTGRAFDVIELLEGFLKLATTNLFRLTPRARHVPRLTIDGVVLFREQWRFERAELPPLAADLHGAARFAQVRAWAAQHDLPRWVFVRVPDEPKPVFVDFASPIYVDTFARLIRDAAHATVAEMLPAVDQTWLPDAAGETYTAELRFVMVDPVPWAPPG